MKRKSFGKRAAALLLAVCLLLAGQGSVLARTIDEIEADQKKLEQAEQEAEAKLDQLRGDEAKIQEYLETLQEEIDIKQEHILSARRDIEALDQRISVLTLTLETAEKEIQSTMDQFKERLVALYKAGNVSTLEILLNSTSFSDFTMRSELMDAMSRQDQAMMDKIRAYMDETSEEREECTRSKAKVAELKKELEQQQEELNALYAENEEALEALQATEASTQEELAKIAQEKEANDAEIQRLIEEEKKRQEEEARRRQEQLNQAQQTGGGTNTGGGVIPTGGSGGVEGFRPIWPLPGVTYISAGWYGYPGHKGLDIAGPWGTAVVAAESGTVIAANSSDTWGSGWGYYVLIYHNGTFSTRYAHLSSLAVSNGQYVEQGQVVGYEGTTGNVTGPHLHFEVYENGTRTDPMRFL